MLSPGARPSSRRACLSPFAHISRLVMAQTSPQISFDYDTMLLRGAQASAIQQVVSASPVLNADLFRGALVRERRRADRSNETLLLVLVSLDAAGDTESRRAWPAITA